MATFVACKGHYAVADKSHEIHDQTCPSAVKQVDGEIYQKPFDKPKPSGGEFLDSLISGVESLASESDRNRMWMALIGFTLECVKKEKLQVNEAITVITRIRGAATKVKTLSQ